MLLELEKPENQGLKNTELSEIKLCFLLYHKQNYLNKNSIFERHYKKKLIYITNYSFLLEVFYS